MKSMQLNLSSMATVGTEESGHCREMAILERFKRVNVWTIRKKVTVVGRWPLRRNGHQFVEVRLHAEHQTYYLLVVSFEGGHINLVNCNNKTANNKAT